MFDALSRRLRAYAEKDGRGYPDWALRYVPLVARARRNGLARGPILEIGANQNGFARFAAMRTVAVDIAADHLRAARETQDVLPVVADIAALPFRDRVFSTLVCVDTFEHVPAAARTLAIGEILRVTAMDGVSVVTFPSGAAASRAETTIRDEYREFSGSALRWLEEHVEHGLPEAAPIAERFRLGAPPERVVSIEANAPVWLWVWVWRVLMCGWPGRGNVFFQVLLRWLTPLLCRASFGQGYRVVIWVEPKNR